MTKENQIQTGLKNFKPKINLNHNIANIIILNNYYYYYLNQSGYLMSSVIRKRKVIKLQECYNLFSTARIKSVNQMRKPFKQLQQLWIFNVLFS